MFVGNFKQKPIFNKCKSNAYSSNWSEQLPEQIPLEFAEFVTPKKIINYQEKNIDEQIKSEQFKMTNLELFSKLPIEKKQEMLNESKADFKTKTEFTNLTKATNDLTNDYLKELKNKTDEITNKKINELQRQVQELKMKNQTAINEKEQKINE